MMKKTFPIERNRKMEMFSLTIMVFEPPLLLFFSAAFVWIYLAHIRINYLLIFGLIFLGLIWNTKYAFGTSVTNPLLNYMRHKETETDFLHAKVYFPVSVIFILIPIIGIIPFLF